MFDRYKCNHWQIAYRRNPKDEFSLVDNTPQDLTCDVNVIAVGRWK